MKYRITKYNPKFRNESGVYMHEEWTSYYDIGKEYCGKIFSVEDYYAMEEKYYMAIVDILMENKVDFVCIENLELHNDKDSYCSKEDTIFLDKLYNGMQIELLDLKKYMQYILRESFWCDLVSKSGIKIEFGYDYYMYITCEEINERLIKKYSEYGVYIEPYTGGSKC